MSQPAQHTDHFTYGDYKTWPEDERWELIDGKAYPIRKMPEMRHQRMTSEIIRQLHHKRFNVPDECIPAPFDVLLPKGNEAKEEIDTIIQPDLTIIYDTSRINYCGYIEMPDMVVEILSPDTAIKDLTVKLTAVERGGVREYWTIFPDEGLIAVYRVGVNEKHYEKPEWYGASDHIAIGVLDGVTIDIGKVFAKYAEPIRKGL